MVKISLLLFVWGPAMLGFALGWLIHHPRDWTGPAVVAPLGLLITAATYRWGLRQLTTARVELRPYFKVGMTAAAVVGVILFGMLALDIIG
jgi:hypothetical protein